MRQVDIGVISCTNNSPCFRRKEFGVEGRFLQMRTILRNVQGPSFGLPSSLSIKQDLCIFASFCTHCCSKLDAYSTNMSPVSKTDGSAKECDVHGLFWYLLGALKPSLMLPKGVSLGSACGSIRVLDRPKVRFIIFLTHFSAQVILS